jgi:hypothetical protein
MEKPNTKVIGSKDIDVLSIIGSQARVLHRNTSLGKLASSTNMLENGLTEELNARVVQHLLKTVGNVGYEKIKAKQASPGYRKFVFKFILTFQIRRIFKYPD